MKFRLIFAAVVLLITLGALWILRRSTPSQEGYGVIASREGRGPGSYTQYTGGSGGIPRANTIELGASYAFGIDIKDGPENARYLLPKEAGEKLEVGQRVKVTYFTRGLPPIWSKVHVIELELIP